jgi:hypothetical protein
LDKRKIIKLLYSNNDIIHHILYNYDNEIILKKEEKTLSFIFYTTLLIKDNLNKIYYSFTIEFIRNINNITIENKNIYLELILSKAIFDLIDAYKGLDEFYNNLKEIQEIENNNIHKIEKLIKEIIDNKKNELKLKLNLAYVKSKTIDQIYIDIIIDLLKNKSENYNYIYNIITEMNLESISITKTMFEEIKNFVDDEKNGTINKYLISKYEDLFDENKISFSYILLKYILKSSAFICQITFFSKERNTLLKLFKSNPNLLSILKINKIDQQIIDKLNYILEVMFNSEYYNTIFKTKDINLFFI